MPMRTVRRTRNLSECVGAILLTLSASAVCASGGMLVDKHRLSSSLARLESTLQAPYDCSSSATNSTAHRAVLRQLTRHLQDAGMMTHSDAAGNLIGRLNGRHAWPALVMGSRIDRPSPHDLCAGLAGAMAAVEVARTLHDNGTVLDHPLEIIVWADSASRMPDDDLDELAINQRAAGSIAAYLEVQVGPDEVLPPGNAALGVVQRLAAIQRWNVRLVSDDSDPTTAEQHRQLLEAASRFSAAVADLEQSAPATRKPELVPTLPRVTHNAAADTRFRLDLCAQRMDEVDTLFAAVHGLADRIGEETGTRFSMARVLALPARDTDPKISEAIGMATSQLQLSHVGLHGDCRHAAHGIPALAPLGLIIVPGGDNSRGINLSPPLPDALANGANTLLRTLLELDKLRQERSR